jgi:hypothetical protein
MRAVDIFVLLLQAASVATHSEGFLAFLARLDARHDLKL